MGVKERVRERVQRWIDGPPAIPGRREFLRNMAIVVGGGTVLTACGALPVVPVVLTTPRPDGEPPTPRPNVTAKATGPATATKEATKKATQEPTKKAEPSETAAATPEFKVDSEGYMLSESGNYGVKYLGRNSSQYVFVPGIDMDGAITKLLVDEKKAGKYNPTDSSLGVISVDVPTAEVGSGYVEGHKRMNIDFSKIKFSLSGYLSEADFDKIKATYPEAALTMIGGANGIFLGLITRVGNNGFTYVDIHMTEDSSTDLRKYGDLETLRHPIGQAWFWTRMIFSHATGSSFISLWNSSQSRALPMKYPIFGIEWKTK